jgi:hypothetical protein
MQFSAAHRGKFSSRTLMFILCMAAFLCPAGAQTYPDFRAHEWGTFTSVAGIDGRATDWTPYNGATDLPAFVEHLGDQHLKGGLRGKMRMETPVLYFYAPRTMSASVKVRFAQGLLTEWYPKASHVEPEPTPDHRFYDSNQNGSIQWDSIALEPDSRAAFARGEKDNQYYVARETSSTPLRVTTPGGEQTEKFLFYRGVSEAQAPLAATVGPDETVLIKNLGGEEIPGVVLFERRGENIGYRPGGILTRETELRRPELNATVDEVAGELESILVQQGLYQDEARAMVETWRNSWFEEGSRAFYIVPGQFLNAILPLEISPAPSEVVRVYVGRLEVVTPTTEREVRAAITARDNTRLRAYQRFLEPITSTMCARGTAVGRLTERCPSQPRTALKKPWRRSCASDLPYWLRPTLCTSARYRESVRRLS